MTDITPLQQVVSSCSGALATSFLITPFDVIKIRLQSQVNTNQPRRSHPCQLISKVSTTPKKCFMYCNGLMDHLCVCGINGNNAVNAIKWYNRPAPVYFTGTFDAFLKISKYEGVRSLWSGLSPTLIMAVPATVIYYTSYDQLKENLILRYGDKGIIPMIAGGLARTGTVVLISPLELIRTKMQSKQFSYKEISNIVRTSVTTNGVSSLWMGWWPMMLRDVPFSMICWYFIETFKKNSNIDSIFLTSFISGSLAGSLAALVTQPFDVVKTKWQIALGEQFEKAKPHNSSMSSTMKSIIQLNGYRGLFAGILPRMMKVTPACAIMLSSYDVGKSFFHNRNVQKSLKES